MNVDFDHARIRRDAEQAQMWIARRWIALDRYRNMHCARDELNCAQQGDVFAGVLERRHEDVEVAFAHLNGERGLDHFPRFGAARASGRRLQRRTRRERSPGCERIEQRLDLGLFRQHLG